MKRLFPPYLAAFDRSVSISARQTLARHFVIGRGRDVRGLDRQIGGKRHHRSRCIACSSADEGIQRGRDASKHLQLLPVG